MGCGAMDASSPNRKVASTTTVPPVISIPMRSGRNYKACSQAGNRPSPMHRSAPRTPIVAAVQERFATPDKPNAVLTARHNLSLNLMD
jgi:hypothetical protein